jgi:hypothetical protein
MADQPVRFVQRPEWQLQMGQIAQNIISLQPTVVIHRSKLFAVFDDLRLFLRSFPPDLPVDASALQKACFHFNSACSELNRMVYHCSASHWIMAALTWPHGQGRESVAQIRAHFAKSVALFGTSSVDFDPPEASLAAQDAVDILQLKGSLMDSATNLQNQIPTAQVTQMLRLIDTRLRSIGPISGLADGPSLSFIPPFLPADLNLEISHGDFTLGEVIGTGTFGRVYTATMNGTMKKVAVKILHRTKLGGRELEAFRREV